MLGFYECGKWAASSRISGRARPGSDIAPGSRQSYTRRQEADGTSVPAEHRPGRENVQHLVSYVREHRLVCVRARIYACTRIYTCDVHVAHVCVCVCACSIEPHTYALFGHDEEGRPVLCDLGGPRGLMSQTEKRRRACAFAWTRTRQLAAPSAP